MSIHLESQTFFKKNKKTQRLCLLSIYPSVFVGATLSKNDANILSNNGPGLEGEGINRGVCTEGNINCHKQTKP